MHPLLLQVPYSLPKLDLVAIPNFAAGAMENWGLLTYRETSLLVDNTVDDINQRYGIATTVAHETVSNSPAVPLPSVVSLQCAATTADTSQVILQTRFFIPVLLELALGHEWVAQS